MIRLFLITLFLFSEGCSTMYTNTYRYNKPTFIIVNKIDGTIELRKSYIFVPYEQITAARAAIDKEKQDMEKVSRAAAVSKTLPLTIEAVPITFDSGLSIESPMTQPKPTVALPGL